MAEGLLESPAMRAAALPIYARLAGREALPRLLALPEQIPFDTEALVAVADALGELGGGHAEAALLGLLETQDAEVQAAAARALGRCGTPAVVEPLLRYADSADDDELRRSAREAADTIQGRLFDVGDRTTVWEPAARRLGLTLELVPDGRRMHGTRGRISVEVLGRSWRPGMDMPVRVVYRLRGAIPLGLRITRGEGTPTTVKPDQALLAALLDSGCRSLLAAHPGVAVRNGMLEYEQAGVAGAAQLTALVEDLIELAEALSIDTPEVAARLRRNATSDPDEELRFGSLLALGQCFPGSPEAQEASRTALEDPSERLRLAGARGLGAEGVPVLLALAKDAPEEVRSAALAHLLAQGPEQRTVVLLEELIDAWLAAERRAAVWGSESPLVEASFGTPLSSSALRRLAIPGYARLAGARAETVLLTLLASEQEEVAVAAAKALGACGTAGAIESLLERSRGVLGRAELRRAAREAIAAIQARVGDGAGRLSLAEPERASGGLSLADADGSLSLADDGDPRAD